MKKSMINPMPEFFDRYINLVEDISIFEAFDKYAPDKIYTDPTKLINLQNRAYAEGKWSVKDILQHVIDNERIMSYRAMRFSRNDKTSLPGYDEELLAANTIAYQRTIEDLMEEFNQVRQSTISLFRSMSEEMMLRSGFAFKSQISALALGFVITGHPIHHINVIRERYYPLLGLYSHSAYLVSILQQMFCKILSLRLLYSFYCIRHGYYSSWVCLA